jgi:hypothetical protein
LEAFWGHGKVVGTVERDVDDACRTLDLVAEAGVECDEVAAVVEQQGGEEFAASCQQLFDGSSPSLTSSH